MLRVFGEKAGVLHLAEYTQVLIHNFLIFLMFLFPRVDQMPPRRQFAVETAGSSRIVTPYLELTGAFHQAVGHPALIGRIIINECAGCQIERVAVRDTVTRIDLATGGGKREKQQQNRKSHNCRIRHSH